MAHGGEKQKIYFKDSGVYNGALEIQNWRRNTGTGKSECEVSKTLGEEGT